MQQNPKRDLQLEFPITDIKAKIDAIVKASTGSYNMLDKNDVFNTYRIACVSGLQSGIMSITLTKKEEKQTQWSSEIMSAAGANVPSAILSRYQEEFLTILSKALSGTPIDGNLIKQNKAGCMGLVLFIVSIGALLAYFI